MTFYIILSFSVFFISLIGTKLVILTLQKQAISPNIELLTGKRKAHTLNNGGIALVFSIIIGFLGVEIDYRVVSSIFLLTGLPLLSNIIPISGIVKLGIRFIAIMIAISVFHTPIFTDILPPLLDKILAVFLWLWIIHSFDNLEKIEGLLPIEMISIGLGLCTIAVLSNSFFSVLSMQALIFAMSGFGFLWWNKFPAKVMAGEIASIPVGFIAGYLLLLAASNDYGVATFILPAYFLADSFVTFFKRLFSEKILKGEEIKPLSSYCFRAIKNNNSPKWIVRTIAGINMLLVWLVTQILLEPQMLIINSIIAYSMVFALVWIFSRIENKVCL